MRTQSLAGAMAAVLLCTASGAAIAQPAADMAPMGPGAVFRATTLNVSAHGEVKADPDMASITLGVQTLAPTAAEAMAADARRMTEVTAACPRESFRNCVTL